MSVVITSMIMNETALAATKDSAILPTRFASGIAAFAKGSAAGGSFNFQLCASPDGTTSNFEIVDEEPISGNESVVLKSNVIAPFYFVRAVRGAGAAFTGTVYFCQQN